MVTRDLEFEMMALVREARNLTEAFLIGKRLSVKNAKRGILYEHSLYCTARNKILIPDQCFPFTLHPGQRLQDMSASRPVLGLVRKGYKIKVFKDHLH